MKRADTNRGEVSRILILSANTGAGHIRAAAAIEQALRERHPSIATRHIDALEFTNPLFRKAYTDGYELLVRRFPSVWKRLYESLEAKSPTSPLKRLAASWDRLNARPLCRMVREYDPDRVVCTHYIPAEALGPMRRAGKLRAPIVVALTDYDIHTMWIQTGVDVYCVASDEMVSALEAKGIGEAHIHVTGIPVAPAFSQTYPDRPTMRQRLGLRPDAPTVLITSGGLGLMRTDDVVALLADEMPHAQLLAVAGRNRRLYDRLQRIAADRDGAVVPFAFVDNMHELMAASDFAITKSGALTVSECLALSVPMVIYAPVPGQEERNALYVLENGAAVWARTPAQLVFKARRLLADSERLERMRAAAARTAKPGAAHQIAEIVARGR